VASALKQRLRAAFADAGDSPAGWWREPGLLKLVGQELAHLHGDSTPTLVVGVQSRGMLLGGLVAAELGVGFVEIRKDRKGGSDDTLLVRSTPPDYKWRDLELTLLKPLVRPGDRVLLVDDWIETGAQAQAARSLIDDAGGIWIGVSAIVDDLNAARRRSLNVRALVRATEL
jgi:adenine phosphoribosyltransferase